VLRYPPASPGERLRLLIRRTDLELDRHYIERNDFSAARRGYDPDEVDRHLREISDAIAELKRQQKPSPASLATAAADQVRSIVEAAERSAGDIQSQAEDEAKRITSDAGQRARETREKADADAVERVREAEESSERMLERATGVESEIDRLLGDLRSAANGLVENLNGAARSLQGELNNFRDEFAGIREARLEQGTGAAAAVEAEPAEAEPEAVEEAIPEPEGEEVVAEVVEEPVAEVEPETEVAEAEPEPEPEAEPAASGA